MGRMYFEGWKVEIDDFQELNAEPEVRRLGLVFSVEGGLTSAEASGNVATYLNILSEVKEHIIAGTLNVEVSLSTGEKKEIVLGQSFALDGEVDIHELLL